MDFELTEEQTMIRDAIRRICADFPDEYWSQCDEAHTFPWDFYNALAAGGWIGDCNPGRIRWQR